MSQVLPFSLLKMIFLGAALAAVPAAVQANPSGASPPASVESIMAGISACLRAVTPKTVDEKVLTTTGWSQPAEVQSDNLHMFVRHNVMIQVISPGTGPFPTCAVAGRLDSARRITQIERALRRAYGKETTSPGPDRYWKLGKKSVQVSLYDDDYGPAANILVGYSPKHEPIIQVEEK